MKEQAHALAQACRADAHRLCADVESGGGLKLACLKQHAADLRPACREALPKAAALKSYAMKRQR